jgi:hypothetical protein
VAKHNQLQDQLEGLFSDLSAPEPQTGKQAMPSLSAKDVFGSLQDAPAVDVPSPEPVVERPLDPTLAPVTTLEAPVAPEITPEQPVVEQAVPRKERRRRFSVSQRLFFAFLAIAIVPMLIITVFGNAVAVALIALIIATLLALQLAQQFALYNEAAAQTPTELATVKPDQPTDKVDQFQAQERAPTEQAADEADRQVSEWEAISAQLAKQATDLEKSFEIGRAAASSLHPHEVMRIAVDTICTQFDLYNVSIYLLDDSGEGVNLAASAGEEARQLLTLLHRLPADEDSVIGWVCAYGQPRISIEPPHLGNSLLPKSNSEMAVPLRVGDQLMGVLDFHSVDHTAFDNGDVRFYQKIADSVAIALHNARLFSETQQGARHQELAARVTDHLQRATSVDDILAVTLQELAETFDLAQATICLGTAAELQAMENRPMEREE